MKPYNKDAICPKCGGDDIGSSYQKGNSWHDSYCPANMNEHICRYCRNCHYRWPEEPLDVQHEKPKEKYKEPAQEFPIKEPTLHDIPTGTIMPTGRWDK